MYQGWANYWIKLFSRYMTRSKVDTIVLSDLECTTMPARALKGKHGNSSQQKMKEQGMEKDSNKRTEQRKDEEGMKKWGKNRRQRRQEVLGRNSIAVKCC
jgi:hypothetical protein